MAKPVVWGVLTTYEVGWRPRSAFFGLVKWNERVQSTALRNELNIFIDTKYMEESISAVFINGQGFSIDHFKAPEHSQ